MGDEAPVKVSEWESGMIKCAFRKITLARGWEISKDCWQLRRHMREWTKSVMWKLRILVLAHKIWLATQRYPEKLGLILTYLRVPSRDTSQMVKHTVSGCSNPRCGLGKWWASVIPEVMAVPTDGTPDWGIQKEYFRKPGRQKPKLEQDYHMQQKLPQWLNFAFLSS